MQRVHQSPPWRQRTFLREQVSEVNPVVVLQIWNEILAGLVNEAGEF
jgi:hypothetical protein